MKKLQVSNLTLDPVRHIVRRGSFQIDLAPREFAILQLLMQHPGTILSRTQLLFGHPGPERSVDVAIRRLRAKIDDPWPRALIQTVRGSGYRIAHR